MTTFAAQNAVRTTGSPAGSAPGAGVALASPTENTSEPPTGWPSAEITRQLSTWVPRRSVGGVTVTVVFSAVAAGVVVVPSGAISRITSGVTGSLKISRSAAGGSATSAPSAGSARTSDACAKAAPVCTSAVNNANRNTAMRTPTALRQQPQRRRRLGTAGAVSVGMLTGRDLDPAVHAFLAFLHHREVDRLARRRSSSAIVPTKTNSS